jgi:hypothetical protein
MIKLTFITDEAEEITAFVTPDEHIIYIGGSIKIGDKKYPITYEEYLAAMERLDSEYRRRYPPQRTESCPHAPRPDSFDAPLEFHEIPLDPPHSITVPRIPPGDFCATCQGNNLSAPNPEK